MRGTAKGRSGHRRLNLERLEPRLPLDASMLRITEFLAANSDGLRDADGDRSDWIEIFNAGAETVDLSGMYLTDDDENLTEWPFPNGVTLPAGGYLVVFASNKDAVLAGGEIHTDFALGAGGEFLALVDTDETTIIDQYAPEFPAQLDDISYGRSMQTVGSPTTVLATGAMGKAIVPTSEALGLDWTQVSFNDAAWPYSGQTGFGYENNPGDPVNFTAQIKTTLPSGTGTAYVRVPFNLTSLVGIGNLKLRMQYDDGFAVYINGVRVAEANAPEVLQWNSQTGAARTDSQSLVFSEFDVSSAIPHLRVGQNVLAIHALNQGSGSDMLIVPELIAQPMTLTTPESIGHFYAPTPGYGNGASVAGFTTEPTFDVPHGFYSTPQTVSISTSTPGAMIVYTTNGSTPQVDANLNITNGVLYQNPLTISSTTTLRARAFRATYEPSHVEASSYIFVNDVINQSPLGQAPGPGWPTGIVGQGQVMNYGIDPDIISLYGAQAVKDSLLSLSTFSITTDLPNLFDPSSGIYVYAQNRGNSWERPATVELIHPDGTQGFEVNAGLRIRGGYSRSGDNPKHAFRFFFRGDYGDSKLEYPLFGDEGVDEFDVLDLRTSQNYSWSFHGDDENTFEREVFGRDLQRDLGLPYTRSRYHHLYINGVYWGLYQTQERVEEFYAESYFGGQEEDYDIIVASNSYTTEAEAGNEDAWRQLFDYAEALAAAPQANANLYWTMQGLNPDGTRNPSLPVLLDVDALIDYVLIIFYTGGFDSGLSRFFQDNRPNNWFGVYNRETADRGFQFFIHDNEHSLGTDNTSQIDRTGPFNGGNQSSYLHSNPQFLHQDLLVHPEYWQRFTDHVQKYFFNGGAMTPAANIARLNERVAQSDPAIIAEAARWGDSKTNPPRNKSHWLQQINLLRNSYFPARGNLVLGQLREDRLYTYFAAPSFSQHGGMVPSGYELTITAGAGTIYYTTDGATDPRLIGGAVNPSPAVRAYSASEPIIISAPTTVKARLRTAAGLWSGLVEATFVTPHTPGDFDNNGVVEEADYLVWRTNFGSSVTPGTLADGNGDGAIDAADYVIWRKNVGSFIGSAQSASATSAAVASAEMSSPDSLTGNDAALPVPPELVPSIGRDDTRKSARPAGNPLQPRRGVLGSTQLASQDLLLMAQDRQAVYSGTRALTRSFSLSDTKINSAAGSGAKEYLIDEAFSAISEDCEYELTRLVARIR
jgi:hypothetical protein